MNRAIRWVSVVGWLSLVAMLTACGINQPSAADLTATAKVEATPVPTPDDSPPPTNEATSEAAPEATSEPTPPPAGYAFTVPVGAVNFVNSQPESDPFADSSAAYYFLRDRSRTVHEICGDKYDKAMKDVPNLIFKFFALNPALRTADIFLGLGAFPYRGEEDPPLEPLYPQAEDDTITLAEVDAIRHDDWINAIEKAWDPTYKVDYDAAVLMNSIRKAVTALRATEAEKRILVIFGDSVLDFPGGATEWDNIAPASGVKSPLSALLEGADTEDEDPVVLHYVQYDCLPGNQIDRFVADAFWEKGINNWENLAASPPDINQIDAEPLVVNDWIRVYGWKFYGNPEREAMIRESLDSSLPPEWHVPSILKGLLDNFLPFISDRDVNLWRRQELYVIPPETNDDVSGITEIQLPIPGYAREVIIHMLGLDEGWCVREQDQSAQNCPEAERWNNMAYTEFALKLDPPAKSCAGEIFIMEPKDPYQPLRYPAIVWWEIPQATLPSIMGEFIGVDQTPDSQLLVQSRTALDVSLKWAGDLEDDEIDFLNNCYQVDIAPQADIHELSADLDYTLPRTITIPFDPRADPPVGFDLALDVVVNRKINVPNFTSQPHVDWEYAALPENPPPMIHFSYAPTLGDAIPIRPHDTDDDGKPDRSIYTVPVLYLDPAYYPPGQALGPPELYVLKPDKERQTLSGDGKCQAEISHDEPGFWRGSERWRGMDLRNGLGEKYVVDELTEPTAESDNYIFKLHTPELEECGYKYLLLLWSGDINPIACDIAGGNCAQSPLFRPMEETTLAAVVP